MKKKALRIVLDCLYSVLDGTHNEQSVKDARDIVFTQLLKNKNKQSTSGHLTYAEIDDLWERHETVYEFARALEKKVLKAEAKSKQASLI